MRIGIISRSPELPTTARLREAALARGHRVEICGILEGWVGLADETQEVLSGGDELPRPDAVLARIGTFMPSLGLALARTFELADIPCVNATGAIGVCRDKFQALQRLRAAGLPVPRSLYVKDLDQVRSAVDWFGGSPMVLKPLHGAQGRGVIRADTKESAVSVIEYLLELRRDFYLQEFLEEARGRDVRVLVLSGEPVAAIERRARGGDFRANLHRGGAARALDLEPGLADLAVAAARAMGLVIAGVDLVPTAGGAVILEVNSSPGFVGMEHATGIDLAERFVRCLEREAEKSRA